MSLPKRKPNRLPRFDYGTVGAYFITICAREKKKVFGRVVEVRANQTIPAFVSTLKRMTNRTAGVQLWQRGYYDHIIRNEEALTRIREYIVNNPLQWALDRENPANAKVTGALHAQKSREGM